MLPDSVLGRTKVIMIRGYIMFSSLFQAIPPVDVPFCFICFSDALHTYFGLCGLSLMEEPGLNAIHAALNITQRAANHLKKLHNQTIS